ncbi:MAG: hypothetical protein HYZ33_03855 [Ignavibacteriales bacterium]|nr:hypothetical protein [Ignavibacteriales bacterium]
METTESCKQCEKIEVKIETKYVVSDLFDLPNTYNAKSKKFVWRHTDFMAYALIPRLVKGTSAQVDMYLCIDEDVLDDIDVYGFASKFLNEQILPKWSSIKNVQLVEPLLSSAEELECWKFQHQSINEEAGIIPAMQE